MREKFIIQDNEGDDRFYFKQIDFVKLFDDHITQIRIYGKTDAVVMLALLHGLLSMYRADTQRNYHNDITRYFKAYVEVSKGSLESQLDFAQIDKAIRAFNELNPGATVQLLST